MKDHNAPDFDSPEARANFATRHIFHPRQHKARRDALLTKYRAGTVVHMFPERKRHWGKAILPLEELKDGGVTIVTFVDHDFEAHFAGQ